MRKLKHPVINSVQRKLKRYESVKVRPAKHEINLDVVEIEWLLEQAKKQTVSEEVVELQGDALKVLLEENKRYRKVLEFYGNQFNYENYAEVIRLDFGEKARILLEEVK